MREQERRLLVVPEQGLGRTPLRHPKRLPLENPERVPVRKQIRRLRRHEDLVQVRTQVQCQEGTLFRLDERVQARGPDMGPERWLLQLQERPWVPALLRPQERGPVRGQELPQRYRG